MYTSKGRLKRKRRRRKEVQACTKTLEEVEKETARLITKTKWSGASLDMANTAYEEYRGWLAANPQMEIHLTNGKDLPLNFKVTKAFLISLIESKIRQPGNVYLNGLIRYQRRYCSDTEVFTDEERKNLAKTISTQKIKHNYPSNKKATPLKLYDAYRIVDCFRPGIVKNSRDAAYFLSIAPTGKRVASVAFVKLQDVSFQIWRRGETQHQPPQKRRKTKESKKNGKQEDKENNRMTNKEKLKELIHRESEFPDVDEDGQRILVLTKITFRHDKVLRTPVTLSLTPTEDRYTDASYAIIQVWYFFVQQEKSNQLSGAWILLIKSTFYLP